jgi:hypothetical protein
MKFYRNGATGFCLLLLAAHFSLANPGWTDEIYGPVNLLKTTPTPFGAAAPNVGGTWEFSEQSSLDANPIASAARTAVLPRRSLSDRLVQSRLYLPGRMVLGRPAEFTIKGRPGYHAALAMADKDAGAKPIYGHALRLGPDRKLVSLGDIPSEGVLQLVIETPIEGDLIGQNLFFEAAIWQRPDFSDLEIATPVNSEGQIGVKNGVLVSAESEQKRGIRFVPDSTMPTQKILESSFGVGSGRP